MGMHHLDEAVDRANARDVLRTAYRRDVDELAEELAARVRDGDFDQIYYLFESHLTAEIARHRRVTESVLVFETIAYSENRNAIEFDFVEGWSVEIDGPWARFERPIDPETGFECFITLPAWNAVAFHAFYRDVYARLVELLGESPEEYVATRLGHRRPS